MERPAFVYKFGPYTADPYARRLVCAGTEIPLHGKAFELLLIFLESSGAALTRDALYEELWPGGTVEDGNLSQNVYLVRRALCRAGEQYVQTIPRFGYRFSTPVLKIERSAQQPARFAFRAAIASLVILALSMAGSSPAHQRPPLSVSAREAYALGGFHLHLRTPHELEFARDYFKQTIQRAPQNASGYAGLASTYALRAEYDDDGSPAQRHYVALARNNRDAALARDPRNGDALAAAGFIAYRFDQNAEQAQQYLTAALASDPDNAAAHHWYGVLLLAEGNTPRAVAELEVAHRLDPTAEIFMRWLARAYAYAKRPNDALDMAAQALRIEPHDEASLLVRATAQEERGDLNGALKTLRIVGQDPWEHQFVDPDEARIEVLMHAPHRQALIDRVNAAVANGKVNAFEASLFYFSVGRQARAKALLRTLRGSLVDVGLQRKDPRYLKAL